MLLWSIEQKINWLPTIESKNLVAIMIVSNSGFSGRVIFIQLPQQQSEPPSTTTTDVDASMSMPAFDDVISEKPTVTDHTEPMTAQDMPDVGAALGALGDASAAPDLSTEGITPMETDISAADNGAAQ